MAVAAIKYAINTKKAAKKNFRTLSILVKKTIALTHSVQIKHLLEQPKYCINKIK